MEKSWECDRKVMLFVNFEKEYSSINRNSILKNMEKMGTKKGCIRIIKEIYMDYKYRVRTSHGNTECFNIRNLFKQGSILS